MTEFPTFTFDETPVFTDEEMFNAPLRFVTCGRHSCEEESPLVVDAIESKLAELERSKKFLTQEGFLQNTTAGRREYEMRKNTKKLLDIRAVQLALTHIPHFIVHPGLVARRELRALKKVQRFKSSYGLKHQLEHYRENVLGKRGYITNGDFIMAMLLLGYPMKREGKNAAFKCIDFMERVEFMPNGTSYVAYVITRKEDFVPPSL